MPIFKITATIKSECLLLHLDVEDWDEAMRLSEAAFRKKPYPVSEEHQALGFYNSVIDEIHIDEVKSPNKAGVCFNGIGADARIYALTGGKPRILPVAEDVNPDARAFGLTVQKKGRSRVNAANR